MDIILDNKDMEELLKSILKLKTVPECKKFFRDLFTLNELQAMQERFQVAKEVSKKTPYREIARKTGSSTATITRIAHWFHHGEGGYKLILNRKK